MKVADIEPRRVLDNERVCPRPAARRNTRRKRVDEIDLTVYRWPRFDDEALWFYRGGGPSRQNSSYLEKRPGNGMARASERLTT